MFYSIKSDKRNIWNYRRYHDVILVICGFIFWTETIRKRELTQKQLSSFQGVFDYASDHSDIEFIDWQVVS